MMKSKDLPGQDVRDEQGAQYHFDYLVVSTPRSGTKFMAKLFASAGKSIGHEMYFGMPGYGTYLDKSYGDSSWLAVPFLHKFDKATTKIHIVRHPLKTVSSILQSLQLSKKGIEGNPYARFKIDYLPSILKYKGLDRYLHFWIRWHRTIEEFQDCRWKLEDINKDPHKFLNSVGVEVHKNKKLWDNKKTNTWGEHDCLTKDDLAHCELRREFLDLAEDYGYKL